jgi:hypothetical protein
MQPARRVFNPTSLPSLRAPRPRRDFYNGTSRVGLGELRNNGATKLGRWRGLRKESTETGEDKSGHISASANEGILFFDSKFSKSYLPRNMKCKISVVRCL